MILQQCSINGAKYEIVDSGIREMGRMNVLRLQQYNRDIVTFFQALAVCHTVQVADADGSEATEKVTDEDLEATFEIIDSVTAFLSDEDDVDEVQRVSETRTNTLQNELCSDSNLLDDIGARTAPTQGKLKRFPSRAWF